MDNSQNIIDSHDVIKAVEDYQDELGDLQDALDTLDLGSSEANDLVNAITGLLVENEDLLAFADEFKGYALDYHYGAIAIRDSYFREYAMELANEIIGNDTDWPLRHIDWDEAARELQSDYYPLDFGGVTYWVR